MPVPPRTRAWGIGLATATAVISGFAVFLNGYGVSAWTSAGSSTASYTTAKNLVAASALALLAWYATRRRSGEGFTQPARPVHWLGLVVVGVVGGSVPFLLFFEGLSRASTSQAAFIHKTLIVWVALLAVPLLRERLGLMHAGAIGSLIAGQYLMIGGLGELTLGTGELMILAATVLWAFEVIIAKRLLADLSPATVGTARMGIGVVVLIGYALATGAIGDLASLGAAQWAWALATGIILTGYVATWYSGLARAPAVDVTAVLIVGAVITALLRTAVQGAPLPSAAGLALVLLGATAVGWAGRAPRRTVFASTTAPNVVVGLGNEIACDDGVGIHVARALEERLLGRSDIEVVALPWAGFALLDVLRGRRRAAIVDCLTTGAHPPGAIVRLAATDLAGSVRLNSFHDISYPTVMGLGNDLGWDMPDDVAIWGVEAGDPARFGETLSPEVAASVDQVVDEVARFIDEPVGAPR